MIDEARQLGVSLAPLDINFSSRHYTVERNSAGGYSVRIALSSISGISDAEIDSIIAGRPYLDLADFFTRSGASHPIIESLILTGAFDQVHGIGEKNLNHRDLLLHLSDLTRSPAKNISGSQMVFGFMPPALAASGLPAMGAAEKVRNEVERLGMDITHHMLEFYAPFLNAIGAVKSSDLLSLRSHSEVLVAGVKVAMQTPPVRSGRRVIFLTLDDGYGCTDSTFFSDAQEGFASTLYSTSLLLVRGTTRRTGERGISINANGAWDLREAYEKWSRKLIEIAAT
jgi:error-prone DNA polymerase